MQYLPGDGNVEGGTGLATAPGGVDPEEGFEDPLRKRLGMPGSSPSISTTVSQDDAHGRAAAIHDGIVDRIAKRASEGRAG